MISGLIHNLDLCIKWLKTWFFLHHYYAVKYVHLWKFLGLRFPSCCSLNVSSKFLWLRKSTCFPCFLEVLSLAFSRTGNDLSPSCQNYAFLGGNIISLLAFLFYFILQFPIFIILMCLCWHPLWLRNIPNLMKNVIMYF